LLAIQVKDDRSGREGVEEEEVKRGRKGRGAGQKEYEMEK
jgi:hypothetical protein